jgi:hypothetical protein
MFGGLSLCSSLPSPWNDRLFLFVAAFMPLVALLTVCVVGRVMISSALFAAHPCEYKE